MPETVSLESLRALAGETLGPSSWLCVDQARIDLFAEATGDDQFIHVDPERAAKTPMGATIAHGFLTLSLLPKLSEEIAVVPEGLTMAINYGLNRVRFLQPVKVDSELRLTTKVLKVAERAGGRILVTGESTVEIRGERRPALVAETLLMFVVET